MLKSALKYAESLRLFELARVLVGFDHLAGIIVNPNHSAM
jgi:hypothetical protein